MGFFDVSSLKDWLTVGALVIASINSLVLFLRKPGTDAQAIAQATSEALQDHRHAIELRVQQLETHVEHLPTAAEISKLQAEMNTVQAQLSGLRDMLAPIANQVALINQFLLNQGNNKS
jgi:hypothetical protein